MNYFCCDQNRRALLKRSAFNGIDYLEVLDRDAPSGGPRQQTLVVHFVKPVTTPLSTANVIIEGGERIRGIVVTEIQPDADPGVRRVIANQAGDFSIYTLRLVHGPRDPAPPEGIDPLFAEVEFSFKVECPADFDCKPVRHCPEPTAVAPEIDCLAKDYASFRRLMLDRMAALMPEWRERNPADLGVTLVELLAYIGDHLSYQQDAVATEAYLGTARRRVSVRRHARLIDYFMHDGANARTWVQVRVEGAANLRLPQGSTLLSRLPEQPPRIVPAKLPELLKQRPTVFETMTDALLFDAHNELTFHTWGDDRCCLPRGATRATLKDDPSNRVRLRVGDVLLFEERIGPTTGREADADPSRRHAVRLTRVDPEASAASAEIGEGERTAGPLRWDEVVTPPQAYVEIEWAEEDALPFPFCLSSEIETADGPQRCHDVSVARGNLVLADHGQTIVDEKLGLAPEPIDTRAGEPTDDRCAPRERVPIPARFNPALSQRPLTQAAPLVALASAQAALRWTNQDLVPAIVLAGEFDGRRTEWRASRDLLGAGPDDPVFVVEIENDEIAALRFGDDEHGRRPMPGTVFTARYRVGNGVAGNVGAEALAHIVSADSGIVGVRNPLPATGGMEPETIEQVRQRAPVAYRTQLRAVTPADYAAFAEQDLRVQRASAALRWTGSWHTVFVTVDRLGGREIDPAFERDLVAQLDRYRLAGHDLEIDAPVFVPLEIEMHVCVRLDTFRADVKRVLTDLFSNRVLPDGRNGLFHPDRFSFGQPVYLSPLYAAAQAAPGVASVHITTFKRRGSKDNSAIDTGALRFGRVEIARLDNDPNFAERGVFRLTLGGGK